jgi:hypothetical protein
MSTLQAEIDFGNVEIDGNKERPEGIGGLRNSYPCV